MGRPPAGSIPTLTEVVPWPDMATSPRVSPPAPAAVPSPAPPPQPAVAVAPESRSERTAAASGHAVAASLTEAELTERVLAHVHKQIDLVLEVRLREALAPALARATDALVRDARKELTVALRDVVSKSVAREMGKKDDR